MAYLQVCTIERQKSGHSCKNASKVDIFLEEIFLVFTSDLSALETLIRGYDDEHMVHAPSACYWVALRFEVVHTLEDKQRAGLILSLPGNMAWPAH